MNDDIFNFDGFDALDAAFQTAEVKEKPVFDKSEVPNGKYQVNLQKVFLDKTKKGDPVVKWHLKVLNGPQKNRIIFKDSLLNEKGVGFLKNDLATLDVSIDSLRDLPSAFEDMLDLKLEVSKVAQKTNEKYSNVYINRLLDENDLAEASRVTSDEPIPF